MNALEWVTPGVGVLGAASFVIAYLRTNISRSTIELYRQDNDALRTRLTTVEGEKDVLRAAVTAQANRISVLEAFVTQAEQIARLERWARHQARTEGFDYDRR